jgi:hypothetical protein
MFDFFNSWQQTTHSTRIMGGLRVLRGAAAFGAGALSCKASFGLACGLVGMPLMYLGADEMVAGGKQVGSGAYEDTGVRHYGGATAGTIQQYIIFGAGMYGMGAQVLNMMRASGAFGGTTSLGGGLLPALTGSSKATLSKGAMAPLKGKATAAGRALQKHSDRPGSWLEGLGHGGDGAKNAAAARPIIREILDHGSVTTAIHKVYGPIVKVRLSDGAGAWWKSNGEFIGFLERFTPR